MAEAKDYIIGIDTGGTFTDVVVMSPSGEVWTAKASTTPDDFSRGVMDALTEAALAVDVDRADLLKQAVLFKHGSTVATNALITRTGVKVGFITTRGFEDTTEIMRAIGRVDGLSEEEIRHATWVTKPEPLVPRERVVGVRERIDYRGEVVVPLSREDVMEAIRKLVDEEGCEAIAVSFLHAWANAKHEDDVRALVQEADPSRKVFWSFGSELAQVAGEYARANTVIINSFLGPTVDRYLGGLQTKLEEGGLEGPFLIMQGNGGVAHRAHATPVSNLQSGPAGGAIASAYVAGLLGHPNVITADMGGTSFDVGLITEGYWRYAAEPIIERFRMLQPIIDIQSIGAGGGTIARVDEETGRLLVGPQSAGASPGPVCYDVGGEEVTVTDCDLVLGIIDPDYFLGGRKSLNKDKAEKVVEEKIAKPLGLSNVEAAAGVYDIVNSKMSDLIRQQVVRTGHLPEEFVIYAFGGAGPVHAAGFSAELGINKIYIFPTSPVFSAFGVASADVIHTRVITCQYILPDPTRGTERAARHHRERARGGHDRGGLQGRPGGIPPVLHHALPQADGRGGDSADVGPADGRPAAGVAGELRDEIRGTLRRGRGLHQGRHRDQRHPRGRRGSGHQAGAETAARGEGRRRPGRQGQAERLLHQAGAGVHRDPGVRQRAAQGGQRGGRPGHPGAALHHHPGAARSARDRGSVLEPGDGDLGKTRI